MKKTNKFLIFSICVCIAAYLFTSLFGVVRVKHSNVSSVKDDAIVLYRKTDQITTNDTVLVHPKKEVRELYLREVSDISDNGIYLKNDNSPTIEVRHQEDVLGAVITKVFWKVEGLKK